MEMKKYIIFMYISWLASLPITKLFDFYDNYALSIHFPFKFFFITINETWFWAITLTIAALWVLSIKTSSMTNKINNTIKIDKKALKDLEKALKSSETANTEGESE